MGLIDINEFAQLLSQIGTSFSSLPSLSSNPMNPITISPQMNLLLQNNPNFAEYGLLCQQAKMEGGPRSFINKIYGQGFENGFAVGRKNGFVGGIIVAATAVLVAVGIKAIRVKIINKRNEKEEILLFKDSEDVSKVSPEDCKKAL